MNWSSLGGFFAIFQKWIFACARKLLYRYHSYIITKTTYCNSADKGYIATVPVKAQIILQQCR